MKPTWDQLGDEFADSSVIVADVDCTVERDLCGKHGIQGYPTIKYYTSETGTDGADYNGGRDFDDLKSFVEEKLGSRCDVSTLENCSDKAKAYIEKMKAKGGEAVTKELARLQGMAGSEMASEKKQWLGQRISVLAELNKSEL